MTASNSYIVLTNHWCFLPWGRGLVHRRMIFVTIVSEKAQIIFPSLFFPFPFGFFENFKYISERKMSNQGGSNLCFALSLLCITGMNMKLCSLYVLIILSLLVNHCWNLIFQVY